MDTCITTIRLLKISFSSLPLQSLQNESTDPWASVDPKLETTATKQFNALGGLGGSFLLKPTLWLCWAEEPVPNDDIGWFKHCFNHSVGLETEVQLLHLQTPSLCCTILSDWLVSGVMQPVWPDPETPITSTDEAHKTLLVSDQSKRARGNEFKSLSASPNGHNSPHHKIYIHNLK